MPNVHNALIALAAFALGAPLHAQDVRVAFQHEVTLHVTSADSNRFSRFALIGAGSSFTSLDADIVLGDTIFLYTPARFTLTGATDRARLVALPGQPSLRLTPSQRSHAAGDLYAEGRLFEVRQARVADVVPRPD